MWFSRLSSACAALACLAVASDAFAQSRVGRQWLTAGLSISPAIVHDSSATDLRLAPNVVGGGMRARVGFQHVISAPFVMAADFEIGNAYFPASTLAADGHSNGGSGIAWQAGLIGRWIPRGDVTGPAFGLGLHTFRASLPETAVQALSADVRFGWYLWREDSFVLAEVGYAIPFLEGVDTPVAFDGSTVDVVEQEWTLHRFVFGFSYGF